MVHLFTWNWQLFSCSKILSSLKKYQTFLLFTFELKVRCDAVQIMRSTLVMLFGCITNMTDCLHL
jgi:hypothetical protein